MASMLPRFPRSRLAAVLCVLGAAAFSAKGSVGQEEKPAVVSPAAAQFFESKVRPVLVDNCFKCHSEAKEKGNLRLDSLAAILTGGDQGPALTPGQADKNR